MKQMVIIVLNNPDHSMMLLEAWAIAGAPGITVLESTGLIRMRKAGARDNLPLMPSLFDILRTAETHHRTIFSVVDNESQTQALVDATERVFEQMEQLDVENSAVMFVLPVTGAYRFTTSDDTNMASR
jgi:hypothetical protein